MKPTAEHFTGAVQELAAIPFFPAETGARIAISKQLASFVDDVVKLRWLIDVTISRADKWPGIAQMRALYATRWRPADGIEGGTCSIEGYTPADNESYHAQLTSTQRAYLPAAAEAPLTPEERASIDALQRKISLKAALERSQMTPDARQRVRAPKWLELA